MSGLKVINTADGLRATEGQLVWLVWCGQEVKLREIALISLDGVTAYLIDPAHPDEVGLCFGGNAIRVFHPETGLRPQA